MDMNGQFKSGEAAKAFILGGAATFTLVSQKTGARFTFRANVSDDGNAHFIALLSGPNNVEDYTFLGTIFPSGYRHGKKSRVAANAPSTVAFAWAWSFLSRGIMPPQCEVWHEGRCGRCGRALTVPSSVESGFGPVCIDLMAGA